jgi:hypothetical protein
VKSACKPDSVEDNHSSTISVTTHLERPTRKLHGPCNMLSYLVLLQVGFTLPPVLPPARCALTAPFHPYPTIAGQAVYFLWHFPWAHALQGLPGTPPFGVRTFLYLKIAIVRPTSCIQYHIQQNLFFGCDINHPARIRIHFLNRLKLAGPFILFIVPTFIINRDFFESCFLQQFTDFRQ